MIPDPAWLGSWIQPHHLTPESLQAYHHAFTSHPARLLVLRRFLDEGKAERLNRFLALEAEFKTAYGLYSADDRYVTHEEWDLADPEDRYLKFGAFSGVLPEFQLTPNTLAYLQFRTAFRDPRFVSFFEQIVGSSLGSVLFSVHAMRAGDFLLAHTDAIEDRRVAFVLCLSPQWHQRLGGALRLVASSGETFEVDAEYNTLVAFDVTARTKHFVTPILPAAGTMARLTLGGWILQSV